MAAIGTDQHLTQVTKRSGRIERVKGDETPVIELHLSPGQYVVSVDLTRDWAYRDRKTTDWSWTAYIVTPLGGPDAA